MKLLKFSASWCTPCSVLAKTIDSIIDKPALLANIESVDVDENPDLPVQYGVRGVPTLIVIDDEGNELRRSTGNLSREKLLDFVTR